MALFQAEDILSPKARTEVIELTCFKIPKGDDIPTLTIVVNEETKALSKQAAAQHNNFIFKQNIENDENPNEMIGKPISEPELYCCEILEMAYKEDTLINPSSKETFLALIGQEPLFARWLAGKLLAIFQNQAKYDQKKLQFDKKK